MYCLHYAVKIANESHSTQCDSTQLIIMHNFLIVLNCLYLFIFFFSILLNVI